MKRQAASAALPTVERRREKSDAWAEAAECRRLASLALGRDSASALKLSSIRQRRKDDHEFLRSTQRHPGSSFEVTTTIGLLTHFVATNYHRQSGHCNADRIKNQKTFRLLGQLKYCFGA